jgi:polyisoprenoid-binding protein YceI
MALSQGTYALGPHNGRLLLRTSRAGLGRRAGHDLTIEAAGWSGTATVDLADPAASAVRIEIAVDDLEVREGTGGALPLTDANRVEIRKNIRQILKADRHPAIIFESAKVSGTLSDFTIEGDLTIAAATRGITVRGTAGGDRITAHGTVAQSRWGIKPYSAFFGALKLADEVEIDAVLTI